MYREGGAKIVVNRILDPRQTLALQVVNVWSSMGNAAHTLAPNVSSIISMEEPSLRRCPNLTP